MPSKERQTADKLVAAYNAMDVSTIIALRTPDCQRVFLPSSLKYLPQSNAYFQQDLTAISTIFTSFKVVVDDMIEGVSFDGTKRIVMYVSAFGESSVGEYRNQYVWKMGFTDDGELIREWSEFVDVGMAQDFYPKLKGEMVRRAAAKDGGPHDQSVEAQVKEAEERVKATSGYYIGMQGGEGGVR
ncbi:hypothetical protein E8E12_009343 [Didymella heteroderae]|uniref:SnoaL-like domain-containing protein n=1 Tax=Didymella heteroderae TaxID=1769908 RepID=A0A9P4WYA4_9PLEO|nr:hypothetical protein E8E12_009343 [Didymella heteroderae]